MSPAGETRPNETAPEPPGEERSQSEPTRVSRRGFLIGTGTLLAAGTVAVAGGCEPAAPERPLRGPAARDLPRSIPIAPTGHGTFAFFTPREAAAVEALTARILPGDAADPGAREAGVVYYVDRVLAVGDGFAEPTYRQPPFAVAREGDEGPGDDAAAPGGYRPLSVPAEELPRYGFQSPLTPRECYRRGLAALDTYTAGRFGRPFAELSEAEQDEVVGALAANRADGFDAPAADEFFDVVRQHTIEGTFCDPVHGGNRDMVGWKMIGFPGAQRSYTPQEMLTEGTRRGPQSLAQLPVFKPGQPDRPGAVYPVRGTHMDGRKH